MASAQDPVIPATQRSTGDPVDATVEASLRKTISLHLEHVTLKRALATVESEAKISITYSVDAVPADRLVSLVADHISVHDALSVLLDGTGMEAVALTAGRVTLQPVGQGASAGAGSMHQQGTATMSGYVRDSATGAAIPQVTIRVDGSALEAKTGADGKYQISGVAAGEYRVTARRVGYVALTHTVTVVDGQAATLNFLLNPPATRLDEVVTTAVGDQRRYQVGNVIVTINVDSIAPTAPVTSVTDLIEGRAPGVEVVESSGLVGGGQDIRIRGQSSLLLQGDPILIVDGVRQDNSPGGMITTSGWYGPSPSRINDLDFSQIATIDVLKGPAATTEYGTDAANGVIVITTKRGTAGTPRWHASAEQGAMMLPSNFPEYYVSWGHLTDGTAASNAPGYFTPFEACPIYYTYASHTQLSGNCVVDSVTRFNPLNHASTTLYGTGPSGKYDLDVSGGSDAVRYYLAAGLSNALGNTHLPSVFISQANAMGISSANFKPNSLNQRSAKANTTIKLSSTAEVQVNVTYSATMQNAPDVVNIGQGPEYGPPIDDSAHYYGYSYTYFSPLASVGQTSNQETKALDAGTTTTWRPTSWFLAHLVLGVQHESQAENGEFVPQSGQYQGFGSNSGELTFSNGENDVYTVDLRGTATVGLSPAVKSMTSVGLQAVRNTSQSVAATGGNLTASGFNLTSTSQPFAQQVAFTSGTLGGYLEEQIGFQDRLFVTGALRVDAASEFGPHYSVQPYEKGSVSWLLLNTGATTVRLRGALGGAGIAAPYGAALQTYNVANIVESSGAPAQGYNMTAPGTPNLQPEKTFEYETGLDIDLWHNRASLEFTAYSKTTQNAIYSVPLGFDFGYMSTYENLGEVTNSGLEGSLTATLVQARQLNWTLTLNSSINSNKLIHLNPALQASASGQSIGCCDEYFAAGYPLYGYWGQQIHYTDLNHNGILEPGEVSFDTALTYLGTSLPRVESSLSTHIGFWRDLVVVGALFDYRTGFKVYSIDTYITSGIVGDAVGDNALASPLWKQAEDFIPPSSATSAYFEDGTFLRFRELNLTLALPRGWARSAHVANLSFTGAVRNLALWTRYPGDPEATQAGNYGTQYNSGANTSTLNNDARESWGSVPLMRWWTFRLNVGI